MRISRRFARLALATTIAFSSAGLVAVSATPASAVGCFGDYCSGQDPDATGCAADAITVASSNDADLTLQLRWSPTCQTNWARVTIYGRIGAFPDGVLKAIQDTGYTQVYYTPTLFYFNAVTYWTPMIYSPVHHVKATFEEYQQPQNHYETAWV